MRRFKVKVNDEVFEVEVEEIGKTEQIRSVRPAVPAVLPPAPAALPSVPKATPAPVAAPAAPKAAPKEAHGAAEGGDDVVRAPIPGVVSEVRVAPGKAVKKGEVLLLLEAMKMQNEILAPYDATVAEVSVNQGTSVQTGDTLVRLQR